MRFSASLHREWHIYHGTDDGRLATSKGKMRFSASLHREWHIYHGTDDGRLATSKGKMRFSASLHREWHIYHGTDDGRLATSGVAETSRTWPPIPPPPQAGPRAGQTALISGLRQSTPSMGIRPLVPPSSPFLFFSLLFLSSPTLSPTSQGCRVQCKDSTHTRRTDRKWQMSLFSID
jgi:hypothetical protein